MAVALQVPDDRHAGFLLHTCDEAPPATRYDHIEIFRHARKHVADGGTIGGGHELDAFQRQPRCLQACNETAVNGLVGMPAFRTAAQNDGIAGFQAEGARIGRHVGAALVDDADDAERHAHALDPEAVRPLPLRHRGADRIGEPDDVFDAQCHRLDALLIETQAIEQRTAEFCRARRGHIPFVRCEDFPAVRPKSPGCCQQRRVLLVCAGECQHRGGTHSGFAELLHQLADIRNVYMSAHDEASAAALAAVVAVAS